MSVAAEPRGLATAVVRARTALRRARRRLGLTAWRVDLIALAALAATMAYLILTREPSPLLVASCFGLAALVTVRQYFNLRRARLSERARRSS